jgi:Carboxypeptidase regulatory-like domain
MNNQLVNINNLRVASSCPADWNQMTGDDRMRHCAECNLSVYNLSAMTEREIQQLVARSQGRLCGRLYRRSDGTIITQDCPKGLRVIARRVSRMTAAVLTAVMSVGFAFAGNKQQPAQQQSTQTHNEPGVLVTVTDPIGAVVSNADVTLTDHTRKKKKAGRTNNAGQLFLSGLAPGEYALEVQAQGFKVCNKTIPVSQDKIENVTLKLPVDDVTVGILIESDEPIISQTESTVRTTFQGSSLPVFPGRGMPAPMR